MGKKSRTYLESDTDTLAASSSSEYLPNRYKLSPVNIRNYMKNKFRSKTLLKTSSAIPATRRSTKVRYKLPSVINKYIRDSSEDSDTDNMFPMFAMGSPTPPAPKHQSKYFVGTVPGSHYGPNGRSGGVVLYVRRNNYQPRRDEEYMRSGPPPAKETKRRFNFQTFENTAHSISKCWKKFI